MPRISAACVRFPAVCSSTEQISRFSISCRDMGLVEEECAAVCGFNEADDGELHEQPKTLTRKKQAAARPSNRVVPQLFICLPYTQVSSWNQADAKYSSLQAGGSSRLHELMRKNGTLRSSKLKVFSDVRKIEKNGSGAWTRTKILGSKGPCATNCTTPEWEQNCSRHSRKLLTPRIALKSCRALPFAATHSIC